MENQPPFDFEVAKKLALEQFRKGQSVYGKGGAFAPLIKQVLEAALEEEMNFHLKEEHQEEKTNRKNGKSKKMLKSGDGQFTLETPRDRSGTFEPQIVKKRETILADSLEQKILNLYGMGITDSDIEAHHIITWTKGGQHDVVQAAAHDGFHLNAPENGIGIQKYKVVDGTGLHSSHKAYDDYVTQMLDDFARENSYSYSNASANEFLQQSLIPDLKMYIIQAKNSSYSLNDYFKFVVNPNNAISGY